MSENSVTDELGEQGGSISGENGNSGLLIYGEPTGGGGAAGIANGGDDVSDNLESIYQQIVKDKPNGENGQDDGAKEEMFVDCAEEIEASGSQQILMGNDAVEDNGVHELNNGPPVRNLTDEMENIRDKLDQALAREANISQEYKEERTVLKGELVHLHSRLKALNVQLLSLGKNDGLLDQHPPKVIENDEISPESDFTLHEIINESSKLVEDALVAHSRSESINKDLQAAIQVKEVEIENLNQKIAELSVSLDAISSSLSSEKENYSRLSEATIDRDQRIEDIANRILDSLPVKVHKEGLSDEYIQDKYTCLEGGILAFIAKHNHLLSEIDQLKNCLTEIAPNSSMEEGGEAGVMSIACGKLHELKKKEFDLEERLRTFEEENTNLVKQLDEKNAFVERANSDITKLTSDLEHEKTKYANTKEKLSMAVTKGKALVQQRDSLKQLLADKTSELEKCLNDLQEKSSALEAAEENKSLLRKLEDVSASLQETITEKDSTLQRCAEILTEAANSEEIQSVDIIEKLIWLKNERSALKVMVLEFQKFLDVLSTVNFPESVPSNELDTQVKWLVESLQLAKEEALKLDNAIVESRENAAIQMDRITASLVAEAEEKIYLQQELEDFKGKYEEIVEKEKRVSSEKTHILDLLLDAAGITFKSQAEDDSSQSGIAGIVDECIAKIKAEGHESPESAQLKEEVFEKLKSLFYVRDQELMLYGLLLEEDMLAKKEMDRLSNEVADLTRSLDVLRDEKDSLQKELNPLSNEVANLSRSLDVLRDEKDSLQKELNRSEEKATLVREKLTMAVKKGKGLVQDRENLRASIDEKNSEIERLKADLQEREAACSDLKDQMKKLLNDVDRIQKLEAEIDTTKKERDQLEQYLLESNNMLQHLVESLDGIELQDGLTFEVPVEKVKWLAGYVTESRANEALAQQELERVKHEVHALESKLLKAETALKSSQDALAEAENKCSELLDERTELDHAKVLAEHELQKTVEELHSLESKFSEVSATLKSHEDALAEAENKGSQLVDAKAGLELAKALAEQELQKTKDELGSLGSKFDEFNATVKSHEDALAEVKSQLSLVLQEKTELELAKVLAEQELQKTTEELRSLESKFAEVFASVQSREDALHSAGEDVSKLVKEKEQALNSLAAVETELLKVKEENAINVNRLSEADKTIHSLEDAFSEAKRSLSLVSEESSKALHGKSDIESEITKLKEEVDSQTSKLIDATKTIKSLEDALTTSESNMSNLMKENESAQLEISDLNSKLSTCLHELEGLREITEKRSRDIYDQFTRLQLLLRDDSLASTLKKRFGQQTESLRDMDLILSEMSDHLISIDSNVPKTNPVIEDDSSVSASLMADHNFVVGFEMVNGGMDELASLTNRIVEGLCARDKTLADSVESFSEFTDNLVSALLKRLRVTKDGLSVTLDLVNSLKHKVMESEAEKEKYDNSISMLEKDNETLLSACARAIHELELEYQKVLQDLSSIPLPENLRERFSLELGPLSDDVAAEDQLPNDGSKHVQKAEKLLLSVKRSRQLTELFHNSKNVMITGLDDLHNELRETKRTSEMYLEEKDMCHEQISKLETDVGLFQKTCTEQRLRIEEYEAREAVLEEKKGIVLSDREVKVHELQDLPLSVSEIRAILDKVYELDLPNGESEVNNWETHSSASARKLFYIIDTFTWLHQQMDSEVQERQKLQSMVKSQVLEIKNLKDEVSEHVRQKEESERMNNELELGLKDIVQKMGGDELVDAQKAVQATGLLSILQKLTVSSREESENLKFKIVDLSTKLLEAQKVAEDLSSKVELLEDSNRTMGSSSVTANDKGVLLPPLSSQSEISDVQEMGPIVKSKAESSVQYATHARTLRKGSSDHLAISIDPESERLVNHVQDDEDKGHVFKSLNTSGLIPRQGKLVADRIDGIWVSGGRVLMGHPRARLGLIAYSLFLHMWLLVSIF